MAFIPTLLASTAVSAADLNLVIDETVEEQPAGYALGVTAGVVVLDLPSFAAPVFVDGDVDFDGENDPLAVGGLFGLSASTVVGHHGDSAVSVGISGFLALGSGSTNNTQTLSGEGSVIISGLSTPTGVITLETDPATPSAESDISGTTEGVDQNVFVSGGGTINAWGAEQDLPGDSFSLAGAQTDAVAGAAAAWGAIASEEGGVFVGVGDLDGLEITTDVRNEFLYGGADLTVALSNAAGEGVALQGYVGPSYRFLGQRGTTTITVDIPEMEPVAPAGYEFPTYGQETVETLNTHYLGGVLGGSMTTLLTDNMTFTLGLEGGAYYANTHYSGEESYSLTGGDPALTLGDQTVENAVEVVDTDHGLALAVRGHAALTTAISANQQLTFGAGVEYLSRVATVDRELGGTVTPGAGDITYAGPASGSSLLTFGDMWGFSGSISFTGQF
ncbi:MAG TPA: hypothetical protein VGN80_12530 [Devosiaceae bacterium]|nr:hypothetical protein [Devosiaceae bacterium]